MKAVSFRTRTVGRHGDRRFGQERYNDDIIIHLRFLVPRYVASHEYPNGKAIVRLFQSQRQILDRRIKTRDLLESKVACAYSSE
jgi:hypothetical protein